MGSSVILLKNPILFFFKKIRGTDLSRKGRAALFKKMKKEKTEGSQKKEKKQNEKKNTHRVKREKIEKTPPEVIPLIRKAEANIARGDYKEAIRMLIKVLSMDQNNIDACSHLGYAYLKTGEFSKAETLFLKVLEERPRDPLLLTNYALCIFEQKDAKRIKESITALELAAKLEPNNAIRYSNLGQSLFFAGDTGAAISAFEQAVRLEPKNIEYQFFLGDSFLSENKHNEAKTVFLKILEIQPLNKDAQRELKELEKKDTSL